MGHLVEPTFQRRKKMPTLPTDSRSTCSYCCTPFTDQDPGLLAESHTYMASLTSSSIDPTKPNVAVFRLAPDIILCSKCSKEWCILEGKSSLAGRSDAPTTNEPHRAARCESVVSDKPDAGLNARPRRGRPRGSASSKRDLQLFLDWKAANGLTGIHKDEFLRERSLPLRDLAAIERGRAQVKRKLAGRR
jgi:hypothetical protein